MAYLGGSVCDHHEVVSVQLNIYVPQDKAHLLTRLDEMAKALGKPKNVQSFTVRWKG